MKKKTGVIIAVSVVIVGIAAGGILWVRSRMGDGGGSADRVYVEQVAQIMQQSSGIGNRYMGVVESQDVLEVNRDSERTIREVQVAVGDEVEVGTPFYL